FFLLSNARQVAVFNQRSRMCTGRFRSRGHWLPQLRDVPFIEIHAIQLLRERVRSKNSRYFSYELNLVLRNGERLALMDHSKQDAIREDAQLLSRTLSVPLWDATRKRRNRG
ncbi:MAG: hypothetical protein KDC54_20825, partial [Lewinella sp.]|nr:hypothetical protein [Lewinella sp.]